MQFKMKFIQLKSIIFLSAVLVLLTFCNADEYHQVDHHAKRSANQRATGEGKL